MIGADAGNMKGGSTRKKGGPGGSSFGPNGRKPTSWAKGGGRPLPPGGVLYTINRGRMSCNLS